MAIQRVGIIGGGQLAWMMGGAAEKLGLDLVVQTPHADDSAVPIASEVIFAPIDDASATAQLASRCDVITFENEFVNLDALSFLEEEGVCFRPSLASLAPLLDKYQQRCYLEKIGLPIPRFLLLETPTFEESISQFGFPVVLKARRHGYDGQGTFIFKSQDALWATWKRLQCPSMLLEEFIPFERELAVIAARSATGEVVVYATVQTQQENQVCRWVMAPAQIKAEIQEQVEAIARHLLVELEVVGVLGIELFLTSAGEILVNEIAPRTHNSGHYTLDACDISQFEMLLRAVADLSLPAPTLKAKGAIMVNLLGYEYSQSNYQEKRQQLAAIPNAHVHWYGKTESRPGRKLGHVTVLLDNREEITANSLQLIKILEEIWYPGTGT